MTNIQTPTIKSLDELKAAFAKDTKTEGTGYWNQFYPFWKMDFDKTAHLRFVPDLDPNNPYGFLMENLSHKLYINGRNRVVACAKMYKKPCPICELSKKYYDQKNEEMGLKYWRRQEYIAPVLILNTPFEYPIEEGTNPLRLIMLGSKIFKLIQGLFGSGDLEANPTDFTKGYDFRITKTKQGKYADYLLSKFAPKQSAVPPEFLEHLELYNLVEHRMPEVPYDVLATMLDAHLNGNDYEDGEQGEHVVEENEKTADTPEVVETKKDDVLAKIRARSSKGEETVETKVEEAVEAKAEEVKEVKSSSSKGEDILAKIRARAAAAKQAKETA